MFALGAKRATDMHCVPLSLLWFFLSPAGSRPSCGLATTPGWRHGPPLCGAASAHSCPASPFPLPSLSPEAAAMGTTRKRPGACSNAVGAPGSLERGCWGKQEGRRLEPGPSPLATWASTPGLVPPPARQGCQPLFPDRNSTPRCSQAKLASPGSEAAWGLAVSHSHLSVNKPPRLLQASWRWWLEVGPHKGKGVAQIRNCILPLKQILSPEHLPCLLHAKCLDTRRPPT